MSTKGGKEFDKGSALLARGQEQASLAHFTRAIAQNPEHYNAYYDLGLAHFRLGHLSEAEQAFQKSIDLTGGRFALPEFGMGTALCQRHEFQQAQSVIEKGLQADPDSAKGKYLLGWALYGLNRPAEAEEVLQQGLAQDASMGDAYVLLAKIHFSQSKFPAVESDLANYLRLAAPGPAKDQAARLLEVARRQLQIARTVTVLPAIIH